MIENKSDCGISQLTFFVRQYNCELRNTWEGNYLEQTSQMEFFSNGSLPCTSTLRIQYVIRIFENKQNFTDSSQEVLAVISKTGFFQVDDEPFKTCYGIILA